MRPNNRIVQPFRPAITQQRAVTEGEIDSPDVGEHAARDVLSVDPDELRAPWDVVAGSAGGAAIEMRKLIGQVAMAAVQVVSAGTDAQAAQARQLLTDTRKALYRILASDEESAGDSE